MRDKKVGIGRDGWDGIEGMGGMDWIGREGLEGGGLRKGWEGREEWDGFMLLTLVREGWNGKVMSHYLPIPSLPH